MCGFITINPDPSRSCGEHPGRINHHPVTRSDDRETPEPLAGALQASPLASNDRRLWRYAVLEADQERIYFYRLLDEFF